MRTYDTNKTVLQDVFMNGTFTALTEHERQTAPVDVVSARASTLVVHKHTELWKQAYATVSVMSHEHARIHFFMTQPTN